MTRALLIAALCALPLAGCDGHGGNEQGTTISLNASDSDGNVVAGIDGKTGDMAINASGFSGKISLPKIHLDASDFDMNGVHLYPGSTISGMNIDAHDHGQGSDNDGTVKVSFESPATPDTAAIARASLTAPGLSIWQMICAESPLRSASCMPRLA